MSIIEKAKEKGEQVVKTSSSAQIELPSSVGKQVEAQKRASERVNNNTNGLEPGEGVWARILALFVRPR